MADRTTKSIRLSEDTQRLLKLLAAFEDKTEGVIVEEAIATYLQVRSLSYGNTLDAAGELANSTPDNVGDIVARLSDAIEDALAGGAHAPKPGDGKKLLKERAAAAAEA